MFRWFVFMIAAVAFAQPNTAEQTRRTMVEVKYLDARDLVNSKFLEQFGVIAMRDPTGRFIVVRGPDASVSAAEEAIRRLDIPPKNIELTFHIISASMDAAPEPVSPDIEAVVKQLRSAFPYKSYHLLETAIVRTRDGGEGEVSGLLPGRGQYQILCRPVRLTAGSPNMIHIDTLKMGARVGRILSLNGKPDQEVYTETGINTNADIREGQKLVVGKATLVNAAAFLVVSAKVVE
jgi:hypothetical protein